MHHKSASHIYIETTIYSYVSLLQASLIRAKLKGYRCEPNMKLLKKSVTQNCVYSPISWGQSGVKVGSKWGQSGINSVIAFSDYNLTVKTLLLVGPMILFQIQHGSSYPGSREVKHVFVSLYSSFTLFIPGRPGGEVQGVHK